jgi:predicted alpha-1,2-mannosidase
MILIYHIGFAQNNVLKQSVDYVNPYIGNISHLLVPTFPTIHLPNSILRVYPNREDFTGDVLKGLPIVMTSHRGTAAFCLSVYQGEEAGIKPVINYSYDNEVVKPYYYSVRLEEPNVNVRFAPSHQSAIYEFDLTANNKNWLVLNSSGGQLHRNGKGISGYQQLKHYTKVFIYFETEQPAVLVSKDSSVINILFGAGIQKIKARYGISFISEEQAKRNLQREIKSYDVTEVANAGRKVWNDMLGKIAVNGSDEKNKTVFYTALYRTMERPVNISEDGKYFSASDLQVHEDGGKPYYTDDWIWDTYRAQHPLRILIDQQIETNILQSYLRMADQMKNLWMPTFPEVTGDSRRMNSNHGVAIFADAYSKGLRDFDLSKAFLAAKKGIEEKSLAPWSDKPAGWLDQFYKDSGYIPGLYEGEKETVPEVNQREQRQVIAVTLGTSYDQWCLAQLAKDLGDETSYQFYLKKSYNYRNVFNYTTKFFHPKNKFGKFIEPFDYRYSGGRSAYYGENNGWTYRWDVQQNIADLIKLIGGNNAFCKALDSMFAESLGKGKSTFYRTFPDQTGNVGQFTMANEPAFHIPYLYNYAGQPWKTQKRIRTLLNEWFRNDLMGMPGDEDGGGMTAFVVFSSLGFYPVTPGIPAYSIGSPLFTYSKIKLTNGKYFEIEAKDCSAENKYIQSATLNGISWNQTWFYHDTIKNGGKLVLQMGSRPNKQWGTKEPDKNLSAEPID